MVLAWANHTADGGHGAPQQEEEAASGRQRVDGALLQAEERELADGGGPQQDEARLGWADGQVVHLPGFQQNHLLLSNVDIKVIIYKVLPN